MELILRTQNTSPGIHHEGEARPPHPLLGRGQSSGRARPVPASEGGGETVIQTKT